MARELTIRCRWDCGFEIVGTFASPDLIELMDEHYREVHADEIEAILSEADTVD